MITIPKRRVPGPATRPWPLYQFPFLTTLAHKEMILQDKEIQRENKCSYQQEVYKQMKQEQDILRLKASDLVYPYFESTALALI